MEGESCAGGIGLERDVGTNARLYMPINAMHLRHIRGKYAAL